MKGEKIRVRMYNDGWIEWMREGGNDWSCVQVTELIRAYEDKTEDAEAAYQKGYDKGLTKSNESKKEGQVEVIMLCNQCNHRMVCKFNNEDLVNGIEEANEVLQQYIGKDSPIIFSTACQEFDLDPTANEAKDLCL